MKMNDLLLVTRNCQGQCEENFLSTVDEFITEYCVDDSLFADSLKNVLIGAKPFAWAGTYYSRADDSYDMRLCCGADDLLKFLAGDYNDSIEEMEDRNPGSCGTYDGWYWETRSDKFSVLALDFISQYVRNADPEFCERLSNVLPNFSAFGSEKKPALIDVIKNAEERVRLSDKRSVGFGGLEL